MTAVVRSSFVKPFSAIPGPKGLPVIGSVLDVMRHGGFSNQLHKYCEMRYKQYGPIYKESFGSYSAVFLHDPVDIEAVHRSAIGDPYPERTEFLAWKLYRQDSDQALGVLLSDGPDWKRMRSVCNQPLMKTQVIKEKTTKLLEVASDMVDHIASKRIPTGEFKNLQQELFAWSLESAGTVLFEKRLGCISDHRPPEIDKFVKAMHIVLERTEKLVFFPPEVARNLKLPIWRDFCKAWDTVFDICGKFTTETMNQVEAKCTRGEKVEGVIASQLNSTNVSRKEIIATLVDLMGAALDTTSNTAMWTMYMLAANPRVQQLLREEVDSLAPSGDEASHIEHIPYMKAAIKETLRMYPPTPLLSRILHEDLIIRNYRIPAGTTVNFNIYVMGREQKLFKEPDVYRPERWLREGGDDIHPFSWIPFGFGVRSCIGRRVAEREIYSLLFKVMQNFQLSRVTDTPVDTQMQLIINPTEPLRLHFKSR